MSRNQHVAHQRRSPVQRRNSVLKLLAWAFRFKGETHRCFTVTSTDRICTTALTIVSARSRDAQVTLWTQSKCDSKHRAAPTQSLQAWVTV
jgi:hypothetical protein